MSGLLFLTNNDFQVSPGTKGEILCNKIPGFSLILFYSTQCVHCQGLIPIFKKLPGSINGCQFGMINVSQNKDIIVSSKNTVAPITYVPYIILYINGRPFMRYDGPKEETEIKKFIIEIASKVNKQQFSSDNQNKLPENDSQIPAYSLGKPLKGKICDEKVCYLNFDNAYQN